jgi:hypothetical protein
MDVEQQEDLDEEVPITEAPEERQLHQQRLNDAVTRFFEHEATKKFSELKSPKVSPDLARHQLLSVVQPLLEVETEMIVNIVPSFYGVAMIVLEAIYKTNVYVASCGTVGWLVTNSGFD